MTDFSQRPTLANTDSEGNAMLLHEALARSRHQQDLQVAREHRLARQLAAGRRWDVLARYAERRAQRARRSVRLAEVTA